MGGLAVRQQLVRRQRAHHAATYRAVHIRSIPRGRRIGHGGLVRSRRVLRLSAWWRRRPGKGSSSAAPKMATMTAISTRFATEMVNTFQCR